MIGRPFLWLAWLAGVYLPPDRRVLVEQILVPLARSRARVLFVGTRFYTRRYPALFEADHLVTLDRDPRMARFGAQQHHTSDLADARHLGRFDAVIANGVFGWGIDSSSEAERALQACAGLLRPGGWLILGTNDQRPSTPPVDALARGCGFQPAGFAGLGAQSLTVESPFAPGGHTFRTYQWP